MSWGGGSGKGAGEVAAAFYAGKSRKRGNCETDGRTYWLHGHAIAKRIPPEDIPAAVVRRLRGGDPGKRLEFSWADYCTQTTARHLYALGVPGAWKGSESQRNPRAPELFGKPVSSYGWYTAEDAVNIPEYVKPPTRPRIQFINLTMPLF